MLSTNEYRNKFLSHKASGGLIMDMNSIRFSAWHFCQTIDALCPDGREKSIAITKIEEAMMWANKAISMQGETI